MSNDKVQAYLDRANKLFEQQEANKPPRKGKRLPLHVIRKIMRESNEGGRGTCRCCKVTYSMQYIVRVRISNFDVGLVCRDCKKEHNYTRVD